MTPSEFKEKKQRRYKWPFRNMSIDEVIDATGLNGRDLNFIQAYCHSYGVSSRKKFETFTENGRIFVRRVA